MKRLLSALGYLITLSSSVHGVIQCPKPSLIEENIEKFSTSEEGEITLNSRTWSFISNLTTSAVDSIKSLNTEISDINKEDLDEHTCNYLLYPMDSELEDATLALKAISK